MGINNIISGICESLFNEFGDDFEIYTQSITQGLKEPCFYIKNLNSANELYINNRYKNELLFSVQYFPQGKDKCFECNDVAQRLSDCLELINASDDIYRCTKFNWNISSGVLNFFLSLNFFTIKNQTKMNPMENCDSKITAKG